jgi:4-amino-4-deoxy-L-arabinose transferase-like glycosyltransferase
MTDLPAEPRVSAGRLGRGVWPTAAAVVVLLWSVSARYGFHRDELYFVVAGRRLDWGYVDQPPLTPLLARLSESIGGTSPTALRALSALAIGAVVVLAAAIARRMGGGATAQLFAGVAAGGAGYALAVGHLLSTATFDYLLWTIAVWLLCGLLDGDDPRRWVLLGGVVGIGLQNKHLIGLLAAAILVALVVTPQRRMLAGIWPWIGVAVAAVIALPNVIWQATNDFPQLEMASALAARRVGPIAFVVEQVGLLSIALAVPAAIGWWRLVRSDRMRRWRPLAIVFALLFVFFLATGGKSYYIAPMYPVLLAAGALWFEGLARTGRKLMGAAAALGILIGSFVSLPLVPVSWVPHIDATGELGETVGWPQLIDQVATVYESIPADRRPSTAIFTGSYGEAGAIDVLGDAAGLPAASSGHNNYWLWGPPPPHGPVIGVGAVGNTLERICPDVATAGVISNPYGVDNEEAGLPLFLCLAPQRQLADIWDEVRHYN